MRFALTFPGFLGSTIQFMQAYASASRHATTALRYHFSQTKDVSNLSRGDAIRSFPYPIYPVELNDELCTQLSKNPNFILQGFMGMQTQIQQAVSDLGINLEHYGRKGKGATRNKGKGKGKRSERNKGYQSDMYRNQAEEEQDTDEDYKPKGGKGSWRKNPSYWDKLSSSWDTGKGSRSSWDDYRRPASSRVDYGGPKDRPDKWWKARDFDEYDPKFDELVQDSSRRRREDDRQQEGRHTRQRGRGLDDPALFFPCEECMSLAGTNTACGVCRYKYQTHYDKLRQSKLLPNLSKSSQPKLPSFPCPFPLNEESKLCDGGQSPSLFGQGKCAACKSLRMYYVRLFGGDDAEAINPYYHTLIVGYERSIIEYLEDTTAKLQQALCDLTYEDLHEKQSNDVQNWFYAVAFPEDTLSKLPRTYVDPKYEPHKASFLRNKWPEWKHLNRAIGDANPHSYSRMMMLFEAALRPAVEEMLYCFDLPSPSRVPGFADMGWDDSSLVVQDLIPWRELIRQSYALAMERHGIPKEWDTSCIKQLRHSLFSDQQDYLFEQAIDHLCDVIFRDEDLWTVFAGHAPWTNETLKKLASSGSWYFDLVYYQITALFKCQTTKKQDLPVPNDQFVVFYDCMVDRLPRHHPLIDSKAQLLSRHWNNKGNSLEALMLLVAETCSHDLVWSVGYIIMNLQFRKQRLPWIEDYLCAPRWLSLATPQLASMAFIVFSALLKWSRLYVHVLHGNGEGYAQLALSKTYHWYAFTNGWIYNWYGFTAQSVPALFQKNPPLLKLPRQGTSVTAHHRAILLSLAVVLLFSACTKSECSAEIDLPRTWNARGFNSQRSDDYYRASFFSTVQGQQTDRHASDGMKERARGFTAKVRNWLQHALNGNITEYEVYTPSSRKLWSRSFTLPNGMIVLSYSIRGRCAWMKFYRRGITKEIEFTRGEAPKLFGLLARAVASAGGEPGSC